ncbi:unnamed protein product [Nesidiocoris tenuis]|uniref:Uncharacterized protein n=1 Tax=Nesidiocoris tenuis TaxID=355587 RepID=A0A6H5G3D0_9HEMI|nr:unnamed protein product [Nesidiocoris tenuis]
MIGITLLLSKIPLTCHQEAVQLGSGCSVASSASAYLSVLANCPWAFDPGAFDAGGNDSGANDTIHSVRLIAMYSDSAEDRATTGCFFDFQEVVAQDRCSFDYVLGDNDASRRCVPTRLHQLSLEAMKFAYSASRNSEP